MCVVRCHMFFTIKHAYVSNSCSLFEFIICLLFYRFDPSLPCLGYFIQILVHSLVHSLDHMRRSLCWSKGKIILYDLCLKKYMLEYYIHHLSGLSEAAPTFSFVHSTQPKANSLRYLFCKAIAHNLAHASLRCIPISFYLIRYHCLT